MFFSFPKTVGKLSIEKYVSPQVYPMDAWNTKNFPSFFHAECKFSDSDKRRPNFFTLSENEKISYFWKKKDFSSKRSCGQVKLSYTTRWKIFASKPKHFAHSFSGKKVLSSKNFFFLNFFLWSRRLQFSQPCHWRFWKKTNCFFINVTKY